MQNSHYVNNCLASQDNIPASARFGRLENSTCQNVSSRHPAIPPNNRLVPWADFEDEVRHFRFVCNDGARARVPLVPVDVRQNFMREFITEPQMYEPFFTNVSQPILYTLFTLQPYQGINCRQQYKIVRNGHQLVPDNAFFIDDDFLLALEIKHPFSMFLMERIGGQLRPSSQIIDILQLQQGEHPLVGNGLMRLYNHKSAVTYNSVEDTTHPASGLYHAIQQLYGYMVGTNMPFGVLSTYEMTWCLCAVDGELSISPAILHDQIEPTLLQCLGFMIARAHARETWNPIIGALAVPPPSTDNTTESSDQSDSTYEPGSSSLTSSSSSSTDNKSRRIDSESSQVAPFNWSCEYGAFLKYNLKTIASGAHGLITAWEKPKGLFSPSLFPTNDFLAIKMCDFYQDKYYKLLKHEYEIYTKLMHLQMSDVNDTSNDRCIPRIWHECQIGPCYCLIMTYFGGNATTLAKWLENNPEESCKSVVKEHVLHALECVHKSGIVHGDIRHENIIVLETFHVVLIDFALATESCDSKDHSLECRKASLLF